MSAMPSPPRLSPSALIAEDEPLLAAALQAELARAWPQLHIAASVRDGVQAVAQALALQPDVLFFDIRMPGQSGLQAALALADTWPTDGPAARPFPALVFVTAYDQYAVQAFEAQAMDYLLKPVQAARLAKTVDKLQRALAARGCLDPSAQAAAPSEAHLESTIDQLRQLLARADAASISGLGASLAPREQAPQPAPLALIAASSGTQIHMVRVDDVLVFDAADKYVRVLTAEHEYLIRTPLKDLMAQLPAQAFWQIHRSTLVRASAITTVGRDEGGKMHLQLEGRAEHWPVSRLYTHLFKAM